MKWNFVAITGVTVAYCCYCVITAGREIRQIFNTDDLGLLQPPYTPPPPCSGCEHMDVQMFRRRKYLLLLAAGAAGCCCCWPLLLARLRGVGLPCGAVGMGPRAVRLEALVLAKLVRRRLPDDLHGRVENLERAEAGWWVPGSGSRRGAGRG